MINNQTPYKECELCNSNGCSACSYNPEGHKPIPSTWTITIVTDELVHLNAGCSCEDDTCYWAIDVYPSDFIYASFA